MAYLPKKSAIALISPIFCLVVGCSNAPKVTPPQPVAVAPVAVVNNAYMQNPQWIAAQATMSEELTNAQTLQSWTGKIAKSSATNLKGAKAKAKGGISDCDLVFKLVKDKKADEIFGKYMDAYNIVAKIHPQSSESGFQKMDTMIEDAKINITIAAGNCKRAPK